MAAMSTALTEFSTLGDKRTYTTAGHTVSQPKLLVCKRKVPVGNQKMSEFSASVIHATTDADSLVLPQKTSIEVIVRQSVEGQTSDRDAALVILRDYVASDEFTDAVATSNFPA